MTSRQTRESLRTVLGPLIANEDIERIEAARGTNCPACSAWIDLSHLLASGRVLCPACHKKLATRKLSGEDTLVQAIPPPLAPDDDPSAMAKLPSLDDKSPTLPAPATPTPAAAVEATGSRRIGRYLLIDKVGVGGMGEVWRALDPQLHRQVAVKLLHRRTSDIDRERFKREARIAASLDHPAIVRLLDAGVDDAQAFLVQEFIEGTSLSARLKDGPLEPDHALRLLRTLAEGMRHAHDQAVIHRDLKPANVLIDTAGNPKLTDFGLARREGEASDLSLSGQILGTPRYMAPEAIRDPRLVSARSDVYGLGTILYEMLTGQPPIGGDNLHHILFRVAEGDIVDVRELNPNVPRGLEAITRKCLARDPGQRYASAFELVADLDRALAGESVQAETSARPLTGLAGERLGGYAIDRRMFSTPQGSVYGAYHRAAERRALVLVGLPVGPAERSRIEAEHERNRAVAHPNLMSAHALSFSDEGHPLLELPLVKGDSLEQVLRESATLEQELAVEIARQLLDGLAALHDAGLAHGPLSPGSVLLVPDAGGRYARLIASGYSLSGASEPAVDHRTAAAQADAGPPAEAVPPRGEAHESLAATRVLADAPVAPHGESTHMARPSDSAIEAAFAKVTGETSNYPSTLARHAPRTPSSDLHAAGALLYQMLTGAPPSIALRTEPETRRLGQLVPLEVARPGYSFHPALDAAVRRAIAHQSAHRFQTARAFALALPHIAPPGPIGRLAWAMPVWLVLVYALFGPVVARLPDDRVDLRWNPLAALEPRDRAPGRGAIAYAVGTLELYDLVPLPAETASLTALKPAPFAGRDQAVEWCRARGAARTPIDIVAGMRRVSGTDFELWLDTTEVSRAAYAAFLAEVRAAHPTFPEPLGWGAPEDVRLPVRGVSWHEAACYALWAGKTLPTEEQWCWAAGHRGPSSSWLWPWGNSPVTPQRACYSTREAPARTPVPAGTLVGGATPDGILDLCGNVWEWTQTAHPARPDHFVLLGGCYASTADELLWSNDRQGGEATLLRDGGLPTLRSITIGVRCAYTPRKP